MFLASNMPDNTSAWILRYFVASFNIISIFDHSLLENFHLINNFCNDLILCKYFAEGKLVKF